MKIITKDDNDVEEKEEEEEEKLFLFLLPYLIYTIRELASVCLYEFAFVHIIFFFETQEPVHLELGREI